MRVVAGSARGRRIDAPPGHGVRPTSEKVRAATFNALVHREAVDGARVLDLFAGSGAMGLEALSRGAAHVTFVESDRIALSFLRQNVERLGFADRATVIRTDAARFVHAGSDRFDLMLVDPPYTFEAWGPLLAGLEERRTADALLVLETRDTLDPGRGWDVLREQRYGGTVVTIVTPAVSVPSPEPAPANGDPDTNPEPLDA